MANIDAIVGGIGDKRLVHVMNMFHAAVAPEIRTPRDATRYTNALSITWPAVEGEVDLGDFIAIEAMRLFQPSIYRAIRDNQSLVCEATRDHFKKDEGAARLDSILLPKIENRKHYRDALVRLFPRLDAIWGSTVHGGSGRYDKDRRLASSRHFQTYFRMSIDPDAISRSELAEVLKHVSNEERIAALLRTAVTQVRRDGTTRAMAWLDALISHGNEIPIDAAEPFLRGAFAAAGEVNVDADQAKGWSFGNNLLRIRWLLNSVLMERTSLEERSRILLAAVRDAPLVWLGNLTASAWEQRHPADQDKRPKAEDDCLLTDADTDALRDIFLERITTAAAEGSLINMPDLMRPLYLWGHFLADDTPLRDWMADRIEEDASLVVLANEFTSHSWGQSSDDLVSVRSDRAAVSGLDGLMDPERFRANLVALQARLEEGSDAADAVGRFLKAWEYRDEHGDW